MNKLKKLTYLFIIFSTFCFSAFFNTCFAAVAKSNDTYYFEKPDSWNKTKVYINLINGTTNQTAFEEPGIEISKVLDKFKLNKVFELDGDLYKFSMTDEIMSKGDFDKIVFSNGDNTSNIIHKTKMTDIANGYIYKITGGTGLEQIATPSNSFNITTATNMQTFSTELQKINKNINSDIIKTLDTVTTNIQKILADATSCDIEKDILIPLSNISKDFSKDNNLLDELNKKIEEGKNKLKDNIYTEDTTKALENALNDAEIIRKNIDYYTNNQVKDIISKLDKAINGLVKKIDTSKLEETLNKAKEIETNKYTDESVKLLSEAITNAENALKDKSTLSAEKIDELTNKLNEAINALKDKNIANKVTNPATGDILYIVIPILVIAALVIAFTIVYSKKKKKLIISN